MSREVPRNGGAGPYISQCVIKEYSYVVNDGFLVCVFDWQTGVWCAVLRDIIQQQVIPPPIVPYLPLKSSHWSLSQERVPRREYAIGENSTGEYPISHCW